MELVSNLVQATTGILLNQPADNHPLDFQQTSTTGPMVTMPPEIIQLILDYLEPRELATIVSLNWTWAHLAAPKRWESVHLTANSTRIVFLITKSVPPPSPTHHALLATGNASFGSSSSSSSSLSSSPPADSTGPEQASEAPPQPTTKRRNSYPWPTLLPYHTMVRNMTVALSSANMVQDLIETIPCCTQLRSFSIQSLIPTEDLLIQGMIAGAAVDAPDPTTLRTSDSSTSLSSMNSTHSHSSRRRRLSHVQALRLDPLSITTDPSAGIQVTDDETLIASSTSESGILLSLLANSCPQLEKLWFSGFHPISVLGSPMDLRPRPPRFDLKLYQAKKTMSKNPSPVPCPPSFLAMSSMEPPLAAGVSVGPAEGGPSSSPSLASLPPIPPVPGMNTAATSTTTLSPALTTTVPPVAGAGSQTPISQVKSLQFVNCTIPPQYLLSMIQYSLPNLIELCLMQCWQGNPLQGPFVTSLANVCPGIKSLSMHATQSHRDAVTSAHILRLLQSLEGNVKTPEDGSNPGARAGPSLADYPLGTFRHTSYTTNGFTPVGSTAASDAATYGGASTDSFASTVSSALVTVPSSSLGTSSGGQSINSSVDPSTASDSPMEEHRLPEGLRAGSCLESIRVWFTHSILNQDILTELSSRERHPHLKVVEFGSEDAFDVGEDLMRLLGRARPEVQVVWVNQGDTGEERDD